MGEEAERANEEAEMSDDLMGKVFGERPRLLVYKLSPEDEQLEREMAVADRELKIALSRPSNGHPRSPRKRR